MILIAQVKLQPSKEQATFLKQTLQKTNAACDAISEIAWKKQVFKQYGLQKTVYKEIRESFELAAQIVIRAIAKVADAYKKDKRTKRTFKPLGAIAFDDRILSWDTKDRAVSIWTVEGRLCISYHCGERQRKLLESRQGESDLVFYKGNFYLLACCEVPEPSPSDYKDALGIDLGITNIAVSSDGEFFSGEPVEKVRGRYLNLRRALQKRGSKNSACHLKKVAKKESRFRKDKNHCIAKKLVLKAKGTNSAIGLEDLKHIRERVTVGRKHRAKHSGWAFHQLQEFVRYKARLAGVAVVIVNARNSSRECCVCHYVNKRNRRTQAEFRCLNCGHIEHADLNASKVVAYRATVNLRIAVCLKLLPTPATGTASPRFYSWGS